MIIKCEEYEWSVLWYYINFSDVDFRYEVFKDFDICNVIKVLYKEFKGYEYI